MDIPLYSYDPVNQHYSVVWMALAVFVIGMIGAIWLFRQKPTPGSSIYTGLVETSKETSMINPNITKKSVQLLFISDNQGKTYAFSEEHYPIREMMPNLKAAFTQWETASNQ